MKKKVQEKLSFLREFIKKEVWEFDNAQHSKLYRTLKSFIRVFLIAFEGMKENQLFSRAAALSYASLIGMGPVIALFIIVSSTFIKTDAEIQIKEALLFVAPSLEEYISLEGDEATENEALDELISQIASGAESMMNGVNKGGSKVFGGLGILVFVWVGIQLLTNIEKTLNNIWGIKKGRPWSQRIVYYWTFLTLGAILGIGSTALFSAGNIFTAFNSNDSFQFLDKWVVSIFPLISFLMLSLMLSLFYVFFPNTSVSWRAAFYGSLLATSLLILNNFLSILYVKKVISLGSLYGSLGILPVLMFGMFFFWVFILFGGLLTYAIQNSKLLSNREAWRQISPTTQSILNLSVFMKIARNYDNQEEPCGLDDLSEQLRVPSDAINESLAQLEEMGWIHQAQTEEANSNDEKITFSPSVPLDKITLGDFKMKWIQLGNNTALSHLKKADPLIPSFLEQFTKLSSENFANRTIEEHIRSN